MKGMKTIVSVLVVGLLMQAGPQGAYAKPEIPALTLDELQGEPLEDEALKALKKKKYVRAREDAQKVLAKRPYAFVATYVLARVYQLGEGNLPRALFYIRRLRRRLHDAFGKAPKAEAAKRWHKKILWAQMWVFGSMDLREKQIAILDEHDALYKPKWLNRRLWPLMKLERFDEAQKVGRILTKSDDAWARMAGYNGLLALASERNLRGESYRIGKEGIEATQSRFCVIPSNLIHGSLEVFKYEESERLGKLALKAKQNNCPNSPYSDLAMLYLLRGEFEKTISALKSLRKEGTDASHRIQFEMENRSHLATLLYTLGQFKQVVDFTRNAFRTPDRQGMTSWSPDKVRLANALRYRLALEARIEELREESSVRPFWEGVIRLADIQKMRLIGWETSRAALQILNKGDSLITNLRPYLGTVYPWFTPILIDVVGAGVMLKAIPEARRLDAKYPQTMGFYDAFEGEIAWRQGDLTRAITLGRAALSVLPQGDALLRWRTMAWLADALTRQGKLASAQGLWNEVLDKYPTLLRQLAIRLPVSVATDGSELAVSAGQKLMNSARLKVVERGFKVDVYVKQDKLQVCLLGPGGYKYGCAVQSDGLFSGDPVLATLDKFHREVFAPKVALTQKDINSLDGSPVRVKADRVLQGLLEAPE